MSNLITKEDNMAIQGHDNINEIKSKLLNKYNQFTAEDKQKVEKQPVEEKKQTLIADELVNKSKCPVSLESHVRRILKYQPELLDLYYKDGDIVPFEQNDSRIRKLLENQPVTPDTLLTDKSVTTIISQEETTKIFDNIFNTK